MGASWVQQQILEEYPHSDIKVYVVWFDMLSGDSREEWDGYLAPDPRATNLWDEQRLVSRTLGDDVEGHRSPCGTPTCSTDQTRPGARSHPDRSAQATPSSVPGTGCARRSSRCWVSARRRWGRRCA